MGSAHKSPLSLASSGWRWSPWRGAILVAAEGRLVGLYPFRAGTGAPFLARQRPSYGLRL